MLSALLKRNRDEPEQIPVEVGEEVDPGARRDKPMRVGGPVPEEEPVGEAAEDDDEEDFGTWLASVNQSENGNSAGTSLSNDPAYRQWVLENEEFSDTGSMFDEVVRRNLEEADSAGEDGPAPEQSEEDAERERQKRVYSRILGSTSTSSASLPDFPAAGAALGNAGYVATSNSRRPGGPRPRAGKSLVDRVRKTAASLSNRTINQHVRSAIIRAQQDPRYQNLRAYASYLNITLEKLLEAPVDEQIRRAVKGHPSLKAFYQASLSKSFLDARVDILSEWSSTSVEFARAVGKVLSTGEGTSETFVRSLVKRLADEEKSAVRATPKDLSRSNYQNLAEIVMNFSSQNSISIKSLKDSVTSVIVGIVAQEAQSNIRSNDQREITQDTVDKIRSIFEKARFAMVVLDFVRLTVEILIIQQNQEIRLASAYNSQEYKASSANVRAVENGQRFVIATAFEDFLQNIPAMRDIFIVAEPYMGGLIDARAAVENYMRRPTQYSPALASVERPLSPGIEWILRISDEPFMSVFLRYAAMSVSVQKSVQGKLWINLDAQALNSADLRRKLAHHMMRPDYRNLVKRHSDMGVRSVHRPANYIAPRRGVLDLFSRDAKRAKADRVAASLGAHFVPRGF